MRLTRVQLVSGKSIPWFCGVAWREWNTDTVVVLPLGLHWVAGVLRQAWFDFRLGYRGQAFLDMERSRAFEDGYRRGRVAAERDRLMSELCSPFGVTTPGRDGRDGWRRRRATRVVPGGVGGGDGSSA